MPDLLIRLAQEASGDPLGQGSFKRFYELQTKDYIAGELLDGPQGTAGQMREILHETETQLRLRVQALRIKRVREQGEYLASGGRHIVKTVGFDPGSGRVIMKSGGMSLSRLMNDAGRDFSDPYNNRTLVRFLSSITRQVLLGLKFIAQNGGLVHSDLKLDNIVMNKKGKVTIIDFGGAVAANTPGIAGTLGYLPDSRPMAKGTARVTDDMFALGMTLVYLAAGREVKGNPEGGKEFIRAKLASEVDFIDFLNWCFHEGANSDLGFESAEDALRHPFPNESKPGTELALLKSYYRQFKFDQKGMDYFKGENREKAEAASAGAAGGGAGAAAAGAGAAAGGSYGDTAAAAAAAGPPRDHSRGGWTEFCTRYPELVQPLTTVTLLAMEAAELKAELNG
jgi:serine/threonine protein kinase